MISNEIVKAQDEKLKQIDKACVLEKGLNPFRHLMQEDFKYPSFHIISADLKDVKSGKDEIDLKPFPCY